MTQTKNIIVLDCSSQTVFITTCEHNPADDMEIAVSDRLDELDRNLDGCSWMEIPDEFSNQDIDTI